MVVSGTISRVQRMIDHVVSPERRSQFYGNVSEFFQEQPLIATFLLATLTISLPPLLLFTTFTLSVLAFSFISAILFSFFWIGIATLLLVPTLFVTCGLGIIIWVWAVSSWIVARWLYGFVPVTKGSGEIRLQDGKRMVVKKEEGEMPQVGVRNGV
ncbi:hypothetical protein SBOR_6435 [Sclerotinia borealis F-4128]|uniref:Uncharacterized protein n=1 Tax=Sclerotinia borealis (strain F-4128) TaxID=1432307 RepID=W9CBC9_SCLBF|nr:hypothetical protein SBOR_6435 [Sclerotinia borealis F-4128]